MARHTRPVNAVPCPAAASRRPRGALAAAALSLGLLAGCSFFEAPPVQRGNRVDPEDLAQITPGVQTRQDVQALLGSPTARSTFDDREWFYISSVTRQRPGRQLAQSEQRVVAIRFDDSGKVREIRELGPEDQRQVTFVRRETPVPGNERTLLQELFGNIGRFGGPPGGRNLPGPSPGPTGPGT
ncbi:outer membrane protein assembly factor BamE [Caldovatus aquaticus]|uniref:Outer membrane protein assembly factor BamE n=1 Tax=Caldovatus aquaticus TaxID=2865671 RepID=A0ABS7EYZ5_9PROT|nr:outer membrane protein assembly factor BamE [Caldovatus aquaticus]MBW8268587.1 outer membrane protein assembly factor BamE [Caldovatus aquaticus]